MKLVIAVAIILFGLNVCGQSPQKINPADAIKSLEWLTGKWNRTNMKPGRHGYEIWQSVPGIELKGWGVIMKGKDTLFLEKFQLLVKDNVVYYEADVKENPAPVYFRLTAVNADGFICENPEHDFPKKIEYKREGNKLKAIISGNGKSIEYNFTKEE